MKLTTGSILKLVGDVGTALTAAGVLDTNGDAVTPVSPAAIAKAAAAIEALLVSDGLVVQENVDKVIKLIPLVLDLAGVK